MEIVEFTQEYARELVAWFSTQNESLMWGGRVFGWPLTESAVIARSLKPEVSFYMFTENEHMVGFIEFQRVSEKEMRFCRVAISPAMRGHGLGQAMVQLSIQQVKRISGVSFISLAVFQHNTVAKACYEKTGFQVVNREPSYKLFHGEKWPLYQMELVVT
ncbi:GNAT family N-acetyltransferase [Vibrio profundi]|uniref:GNAT family N-acetyltransferase n=1 Tax=Vibrio profundi TaxID=1774960 RepID=UPI003736332B